MVSVAGSCPITPDIDEEIDKVSRSYINISIRVLGVCYEIRHAAQGDREIFTEDNAIQEFHLEAHGKIVPKQNVYYSCNALYPEMILVMMALNDLVKLRISQLVKSKYKFDAAFDRAVVWDRTISTIRMFQSAFLEAISEVLSKASLGRWQNLVNDRVMDVRSITYPFVDSWNIRFLSMAKNVREKKILTVTKRLAEYFRDPENRGYRDAIDEAVMDQGWVKSDIRFEGLDYPDEIEW